MSRWHTSRPPWGRRPAESADAAAEPSAGAFGFCRRGYHHGNLKEALIEAARQLAAERGPYGFSLADAARLAGVSPSAPYRHFRDREALLADVSRRGFALFGERLAAAAGAGEVGAALTAMGRAYLAFAREEPGYYGAMFAWCDPTAVERKGPDTGPFAALVATIARLLPEGRVPEGLVPEGLVPEGRGRDQARLLALEVWALSHGLAGLERAGMPPPGSGAPPPEAVLADAVARLLRVT